MSYGTNGGVIGPDNVPTLIAAPGVWSLGEIAEARRDSVWPAPFAGWFASWDPGVASDVGDATQSGQITLDTSDNIYISAVCNDSSAGTYTSAIAKVQSNGNALVNNYQFNILESSVQKNTRLMGLVAAGTNLYISGDEISTGYAWRAKLNSSYAVQWFGDSGGDKQTVQSGQPSYANTDMKLYVSPNEDVGIHLYYGYYTSYGSYQAIMQPIDAATGYKLYPDTYGGNCYPVMPNSSPTSVAQYIQGFAMNTGRMAYIQSSYHSSYGPYNVQFGEADEYIWSGWSGMQSARFATGGSSAGWGAYSSAPKICAYRTTGTPHQYYWNAVMNINGGTYSDQAYFSFWDPYSLGYSGWSKGTRYIVNASDSPATPTGFTIECPPVNDSTDTYCYFVLRDNATNPAQHYLVKHDIANQTAIWQRKIQIYKTAHGITGYDVPLIQSMAIDSTDENVYGIFSSMTMNTAACVESIVFKLPTDGTGAGTYVAGDYTITYGTSNMTVTAGDILDFGTGAAGNSYTSFSNYGTLTTSTSTPTATWDKA